MYQQKLHISLIKFVKKASAPQTCERNLIKLKTIRIKTQLVWSLLALRHSSPGRLKRKQFDYYFVALISELNHEMLSQFGILEFPH